MKKSTQVQNTFSDSYFKRIYVQNILAWQQSTIQVWNNLEVMKSSYVQASKVRISNENVSSIGFMLDVDETNPNALTIQKYNNGTLLEKGIVYDTEFNKPEPAILGVSPTFILPEQQREAGVYLRNNPSDLLCITSNQNEVFEFPSLPTSIKEENRQIRISSNSEYSIQIMYSGGIIVELFQERVSFIWKEVDGRYTWVYIP
jgi:hypothetical protein